jgi:hypothetical protein
MRDVNFKTLIQTLAAGLLAAGAMLGFLYALPHFGVPRLNAFQLMSTLSADYTWWAQPLEYFALATVVFPALYKFIFFDSIPGNAGWQKGSNWGLILWMVRGFIVAPIMGEGFFSINATAPHALAAILSTLFAHLIYGCVLGAIADFRTTKPRLQRPVQKRQMATRR